MPKHPRIELNVGDRFGRLVVTGARIFKRGFPVRCDCGADDVYPAHCLTSGNTTSCGCFRRDWAGNRHRKHGDANACAEYRIWQNMLNRCRNPRVNRFEAYGGRGISVCDRWSKYENFLADMGRRPSVKHSIDRIDVNGNYEPGNCRWATAREQGDNIRTNRRVRVNGESLCFARAARLFGIRRLTLWHRVKAGHGVWAFYG